MTIKSVNIIIPLKNEEKGIKNLIEKLIPVLDRIEKKTNISLIDDHSSDQTWNILKQHEEKIDCVCKVWCSLYFYIVYIAMKIL